jgi:ankyrin repeat protein
MNKVTLETILEELSPCMDPRTIIYDKLNQIQKAIMQNYVNVVEEMFSADERIYKNVLCNGYFIDKYKCHPIHCHKFVCCKTSLYYALWVNCYYYSKIIDNIYDILSFSPSVRYNCCVEEKREKIFIEISEIIQIIHKLSNEIDCICSTVYQFTTFYEHTSMNFEKVNVVFEEYIPILIMLFDKVYGSSNKDPKCTMEYILTCHKSKIGNNCMYSTEDIEKYEDAKNTVEKIKYHWKEYLKSCKIVILLFNKQAYEFYSYHVEKKVHALPKVLDQILVNKYIDINHICHDKNIFSISILQQSRSELTYRLIQEGGKIPESMNFKFLLDKCNMDNVKQIVKYYTEDYFSNIDDILQIILNSTQKTVDKTALIKEFNNRNILDKSNDLFRLLLDHEYSYNFIEKIIHNDSLTKKISAQHIFMCIKHIKHKELEMLLEKKSILSNEQYNNVFPLFYFIEEILETEKYYIEALNALLLHKADLTAKNIYNETPLLKAIKLKKTNIFSILLKRGANVLDYDDLGYNSFHYVVKYGLTDLISNLIKNNTNIVNIPTKSATYPLIVALESTDPYKITKAILQHDNIDYTIKTVGGDNLLYNLLNYEIDIDVKNALFELYLTKNINLLEQRQNDSKSLIVEACEKKYGIIVNMIMNKLLQTGDIKFDNFQCHNVYEAINNNLLPIDCKVIVKDASIPNFFSLVISYLRDFVIKNQKEKEIKRQQDLVNQKKIDDQKIKDKQRKYELDKKNKERQQIYEMTPIEYNPVKGLYTTILTFEIIIYILMAYNVYNNYKNYNRMTEIVLNNFYNPEDTNSEDALEI